MRSLLSSSSLLPVFFLSIFLAGEKCANVGSKGPPVAPRGPSSQLAARSISSLFPYFLFHRGSATGRGQPKTHRLLAREPFLLLTGATIKAQLEAQHRALQ